MALIIKGRSRVALLAGTVLAGLAALASTAGAEERRNPLGIDGAALSPTELSGTRARGLVINGPLSEAQMTGNTASNVVTGNNTITGSFGNSGGLINVFQNTGNNALFQSSTIVNVNLH
jgi:hypothetical protein